MRIPVSLVLLLSVAIVCKAAPQEAEGGEEPAEAGADGGDMEKPAEGAEGKAGDDGEAGSGDMEGADLTEAVEMLAFLRDDVKMFIETTLQEKLFQPKELLDGTVQDTMEAVLELRKRILGRIKEIRAKTLMISDVLNLKQEAFLNDLRMDIMEVLLMLVEPDAATPENLQKVGKKLLEVRATIVNKVMMLIMIRDGATAPPEKCDCEPHKTLHENLDPEKLKELMEGGKILEELSMNLMSVDNVIAMKYTEILAEEAEEERKGKQDELLKLKEISNCLNEVLLEASGIVDDEEKLFRIIDRKVVSCRAGVKRQLTACQSAPGCTGDCESCGAKVIDDILAKLENWNIIMQDAEEGEGKDNIRDEAINFLNGLNTKMSALLSNKIHDTNKDDEEAKKCEEEELKVITSSKNPLWMLVNVTIFGDDAMVGEIIIALQDAKREMREQFCKEDTRVESEESCDLEEIGVAKKWTTKIDELITTEIFLPKPDPIKVMVAIVTLKGELEERVKTLFKDGLKCGKEVEQIKNVYSGQINKCLSEMMEPGFDYTTWSRPKKVDCLKQLRNKIEERRGMLWMEELLKSIAEGDGGEGSAEEGTV